MLNPCINIFIQFSTWQIKPDLDDIERSDFFGFVLKEVIDLPESCFTSSARIILCGF